VRNRETHLFRSRILWSLIGALAACSESSPDVTDKVSDILDETASCSPAQLSGACRGPWAYHPWVTPCYIEQTDPLCPNKIQGQCHPSCLHAEFGFSVSRTERISCVGAGCGSTPGADPESKCTQRTNVYRNSVAGNLANVIPSHTVTNLHRFEHGQYDANCNETLTNAREGVDDACFPTFACELDGSCRLPHHGDAPPGQCGSDQNLWAASASGLSSGGLSLEQQQGLYADSCSTLEDHAVGPARLDLTIARTSASDQYWTAVPMPSTQAEAARRDLVKQAKLMFELGNAPASPDAVRALYASAPGDELACGVSARAPVSASCASFGTTNNLDGPLGLCQRMLSTHVANTVFQAELDGCLDLLNRPALGGTSACAIEYRNLAQTVAERLLAKALSAVQLPAGSTTIIGLTAVLGQIDRWHAAAAQAFATDAAALSDGRGRVLSAFWSRAYAVGSPIPSFALGETGSSSAQTQLASLFGARIETDRQVLAAAFASPAPLDEVPLLLIVADGLSTMRERLATAAPLYDLACRLKGACTVAEANEATLLLRIIGAIGDDTALVSALSAATGVVRAPWLDMFTALRARRDALQTAYRKAVGRSDATLADLYLASVVGPAATLAGQVSSSFAMWNSYASHGVLEPADGRLRTSLTSGNVVSSLVTFGQRRGILATHRADFQRTRGDFAQTVLNRINNKQFQDRIDDESAVLRLELDNLGRDLDGLMASQDAAEQQIGRFLATYVARASAPGWLPQFPVQGHPGSLSFAATEARGNGSFATDIPAVAVRDQEGQTWQLGVGRGDMLSFDVTGTWSPTCALRKTTLAGPNGTSGFVDPTHLQVGPEGFSVSWETNHFEAKDHVTSDFSSVTTTSSICGSASANLLTAVSGPVPVGSLSVSASTCQQWQTGHTETDSNTTGSRSQYSANFAGGLRVPGTPFPSLPAGALLLVEIVPATGGGTRIRDVHVVRSHASFLFPQDATLYLVANDQRDPTGCAAVDTSPLTVNYVRGQSSEPAARALVDTMAAILATLQASKATYVAQGSVTATELSALQSAAYDQLRASCACNLSAFPDEVRGMFDAWLATELAAIERETRIVAAERSLDSLVLRLKGLQDDLAGAQSASRMLALMTLWQLGHLSYHLEDPQPALRTAAELLLESANDMHALMNILYPQALAALRQSAGPLNALRTIDWTLPYDEQVVALENLTEVVQARIDDARNGGGGVSTAPVVLVFPKPGVTAPLIPGSVTAAPERAAAIWQPCTGGTGTCLRRRPTFTFVPEEIYGRPLVGLGCSEAAPVVQAFALVAVNSGSSSNDDWNNNPRRADIFRAGDMLFPTESGILGYRTDGAGAILAPSRVRVLATDATSVATIFNTHVRQGGGDLQGVSPFNSFTVDLGTDVTNAAPLSSATAIVAFFDVQTRTATGPLTSIGTCSQPPTPPAGGGGPDDSPPGGGGGPDDSPPAGGDGGPDGSPPAGGTDLAHDAQEARP
jgi:hypothetical protein